MSFPILIATVSDYSETSVPQLVLDETPAGYTLGDAVKDIISGERGFVQSVYSMAPGLPPVDVSHFVVREIERRIEAGVAYSQGCLRFLGFYVYHLPQAAE